MCLELWVKSKWYWVQCVGSSLYTQLIVICSLTYKVVGKVLATSDMGRTAVESVERNRNGGYSWRHFRTDFTKEGTCGLTKPKTKPNMQLNIINLCTTVASYFPIRGGIRNQNGALAWIESLLLNLAAAVHGTWLHCGVQTQILRTG